MPVYLAMRPANVAADDNDFTPLIVRRDAILQWLTFLQASNPLYHATTGFTINMAALNELPENGVPAGLRRIFESNVPGSGATPAMAHGDDASDDDLERHPCEAGDIDPVAGNDPVITHSFYPNNQLPQKTVVAKLDAALAKFNARQPDVPCNTNNTEIVDWPKLCGIVNERHETRGCAALAFPTLFPYGPEPQGRRRSTNGIKTPLAVRIDAP